MTSRAITSPRPGQAERLMPQQSARALLRLLHRAQAPTVESDRLPSALSSARWGKQKGKNARGPPGQIKTDPGRVPLFLSRPLSTHIN